LILKSLFRFGNKTASANLMFHLKNTHQIPKTDEIRDRSPIHFEKFQDLIIIGARPAGVSCATEAAKMGNKVLVIEKREIGGTCGGAAGVAKMMADASRAGNLLKNVSSLSKNTFVKVVENMKGFQFVF
jgi:ribulose 1,5-bisphosphate synthetase/thiazole synthase